MYDMCVYSYINLDSADKRKNSEKEGNPALLSWQNLRLRKTSGVVVHAWNPSPQED